MKDERYKVIRFDDVSIGWTRNQTRWAPVRVELGIEAFGCNAYRADRAGDVVIAEHDEMGQRTMQHQELYAVASGHATFTVDGEEIDAPAGTFVFVRDPAAKRRAEAREAGTMVIAVGGRPGEVFEPSPWERNTPAMRYWETQEWDKAIDALSKVHAEHPDDAAALYNLACAEARGGESEAAVDHLRRSLELDPSLRAGVEEDEDFEALREDPRFTELARA